MHVYLNYPCFYEVTKLPSVSSFPPVSTRVFGTKSEISGVMSHLTTESKIQLVGCKLSPKSLLGLSVLEDTYAYHRRINIL